MFDYAEPREASSGSWDEPFLPVENAFKKMWLAGSRHSFFKRLAKQRLLWEVSSDTRRSTAVLELSASIRRDGFTNENIATALAWLGSTLEEGPVLTAPGMADVVCRMLKGFVVETNLDRGSANLFVAAICTLTSQPVHIVVERSTKLASALSSSAALVEQLGLTIACVDTSQSKSQRQQAYRADIVFGHAHQFAQDSLHDRMLVSSKNALQLDIEQLRTNRSRVDHAITRGLGVLVAENVEETLFEEIDVPVVIYQSELDSAQKMAYQQAVDYARALSEPEDFTVEKSVRSVVLTDVGKQKLEDLCGDSKNKLWRGVKSRHYLIVQALVSVHVLRPEIDYQVESDGFGSLAPGFSWSRELLCLLAIKHGVERDYSGYQLARMSIHQLVSGYRQLYGSGGVASLYERELRTLYGLAVVRSRRAMGKQQRESVADRQELIRKVVNDMADESQGPCLIIAAEMYDEILEEAQQCNRVLVVADAKGSVTRIDGQVGNSLLVHESAIESDALLLKSALFNNGLDLGSVRRVVVCDPDWTFRRILTRLARLDIDQTSSCVIYNLDSDAPDGRLLGLVWWNLALDQRRSEKRIAQQELAERLRGVQMDAYLKRLLAFSGRVDY